MGSKVTGEEHGANESARNHPEGSMREGVDRGNGGMKVHTLKEGFTQGGIHNAENFCSRGELARSGIRYSRCSPSTTQSFSRLSALRPICSSLSGDLGRLRRMVLAPSILESTI